MDGKTLRLNALQVIFGIRVYIFDQPNKSKKSAESIFHMFQTGRSLVSATSGERWLPAGPASNLRLGGMAEAMPFSSIAVGR